VQYILLYKYFVPIGPDSNGENWSTISWRWKAIGVAGR